MYKIDITSLCKRKLKSLQRQNKPLFLKTQEMVKQLQIDPFKAKGFHNLVGDKKGFSAVDVEPNHLLIILVKIKDNEVKLVNMGNHDEVYEYDYTQVKL